MATVNRFEDLEIWQLARKLYSKISLIAERLRLKREFRFAEQMKAAAGSIMDNIAEGFERSSRLEFINAQSISKGECGELKSQIYRCFDDKYISETEFTDLYKETDILTKKIAAFIMYLNSCETKGLKFKDRQK
ncbi:four helix bundle protein [Longitalea luteola]|uniref:four helix bundle protein n=1 Tax=Longitalea luteola TaxID=2812563 RepID=UPI001A96A43A|nr:four helix bundle protein [Longitalea luteola]